MPLFFIAIIAAVLTFGLLLLGGTVHSSGSSLACPDWPLCFGQVFPKMEGGVAIEHSHRLLAALIGVLTISIVVAAWKTPLRKIALTALAIVIFQGVLGGLTVLLRLPILVSTAHLGTSMIFFSFLITLVYRSSAQPLVARVGAPAENDRFALGLAKARRIASLTLGLVWLQAVLGAFTRHSGAALACGTDPIWCELMTGGGLLAHLQMIQLAHRAMALVVGAHVIALAARLFGLAKLGNAETRQRLRPIGIALVVMLGVQITLGGLSVMSSVQIHTVTAHLGGGALLLALTLLARLCLQPFAPLVQRQTQPALGAAV